MSYKSDVDEGLGLLGRVFQHKLQESTPDVRFYSTKEYPQRDYAVSCGVRKTLALSVFEQQCCVGVLELVFTDDIFDHDILDFCDRTEESYMALKEADLKTLTVSLFSKQKPEGLEYAMREIKDGLEVVCKTHQLPLAQIWHPGCCSSDVGLDLNGPGEEVIIAGELYTGVAFNIMKIFHSLCRCRPLRKGQGLVGKALLSNKPFFCRDITQFSMTEYPLAHYARKCGLAGSFAICLRSTYTKNCDYVLEFFLPPYITNIEDVQTLLDSLFTTMKQSFPSFKVASGKELGEELSVEVIKFSELDSFKICQPTGSPPSSKAIQIFGGGVNLGSSDQQLIMENAIKKGKNVIGAEQGVAAITGLEKTCRVETLQRKHGKTENSFSKEDIEQCFGMQIDDAAENLGISRSTLKRICRKYGINRWPFPKRKKVSCSPSNHKRVHEFVQGGEEEIPESSRGDPSRSKQATAAVAHTSPPITLTIKATHRDDIIKFQLSSSAAMAELEEEVTRRLKKLNVFVGTFKIKYQDVEGDWVSIACDDDLQDCMVSARSLAKTTIRMLIDESIINQAP